jgi:hypothetical protein
VKYDTDHKGDERHQAASSLVTLIQQLAKDEHLHLVMNASGTSIAEVHADEVAKLCLDQCGVAVSQDANLHAPHSYQVKLGPIRGAEALNGLRGMLMNTTNFRLAFEPALIRDQQQKRERANAGEIAQETRWAERTTTTVTEPNSLIVR